MNDNPISAVFAMTPPDFSVPISFGGDSLDLARVVAASHCYAIKVARLVQRMEIGQLVELGQVALDRLAAGGRINDQERNALGSILDSAAISDDLSTHATAIRRSAESLAKAGAVASMLIQIAQDSVHCAAGEDTQGQTTTQLPPGAHAVMSPRARKVAAWLADVAAGAVGAAAGGAGGVPGALLLGGAAAGAASGAVLT